MILFVCEGNVCRSPLAAAALSHSLTTSMGITVGSAGTRALTGEPADPATAAIAARLGLSLAPHRATQVTADMLARADMVVAATRQIRSAVVQTYPPAVKYAFTMRQLARILRSVQVPLDSEGLTGPAHVTRLARTANHEKARLVAPQGDDDNIIDPRGRAARVHEQSAEQVVTAVAELAAALGGTPLEWLPARGGLRWDSPGTAAS